MRESRGSLYLLTGLVIGIALGLGYAWMFQPVQYTNTSPAGLRSDYKDQYRIMIASAYTADDDLLRARARLALLKDPDPYRMLAEQAQRALAQGLPMEEARALGILAIALNQPAIAAPQGTPANPATTENAGSETPVDDISGEVTSTLTTTLTEDNSGSITLYTPSPVTATIIASPAPTATSSGPALPTLTPTATPGAPYVINSKELICDPKQGQDMIKLTVSDAAGQPVPGVEAIITWNGGEDHFFTGLKPEISMGYADYSLTHGITYTLRLAEGGQTIPNLVATQCQKAYGTPIWGVWQLQFIQP